MKTRNRYAKLAGPAIMVTALCAAQQAGAVTPGEDIATTIMLRGHECGKPATNIRETSNADGSKVILADCPNGKKYRIDVSADGRVKVTPR